MPGRDLSANWIAYWPGLLNDSGTLQDFGPSALHGTLGASTAAPSIAQGPWGHGPVFDGTNDLITTSSLGATVRSISFWINLGSTSEEILQLATAPSAINITAVAGVLTLTGLSGTVYINGKAGTAIGAKAWTHVTVVASAALTADAFKIGCVGAAYGAFSISELTVYNTALTASEAAYLANDPPKNATLVPTGKFRNYMQFDGTDDYLSRTVSNFRSGDASGMITFWMRLTSSTSDYKRVFSSGDVSVNQDVCVGVNSVNSLDFETNTNVVKGNTTLIIGSIYHVAIGSTGSGYFMYLNGSSEGLTVPTGNNNGNWFSSLPTQRDNIVIGSRITTSTAKYFPGIISNVKIWPPGTYTQAQVLEDMQKNSVTGVSPVAYWPLDEPSGRSCRDLGTDVAGPYTLTQTTGASQPKSIRDMAPQFWTQPVFTVDFSDGKLPPGSKVISGTWQVIWDASLKMRVLKCVTAGAIAIPVPSQLGDLTKQNVRWKWRMNKVGDTNYAKVVFAAKTPVGYDAATGYGYSMWNTEAIIFHRIADGSTTTIRSKGSGYTYNTWYTYRVDRLNTGDFTAYINDISWTPDSGVWPANSVTHTSGICYMVFDIDALDCCADIQISRY